MHSDVDCSCAQLNVIIHTRFLVCFDSDCSSAQLCTEYVTLSILGSYALFDGRIQCLPGVGCCCQVGRPIIFSML